MPTHSLAATTKNQATHAPPLQSEDEESADSACTHEHSSAVEDKAQGTSSQCPCPFVDHYEGSGQAQAIARPLNERPSSQDAGDFG